MKTLFILSLMALISVFTGCGLFGGTKEEPIVLPPPPVVSTARPKPARREVGSLWGEDSNWNEIYTFTPARRVGDIIQIHVTDTLKFRIEQSLRAKDPQSLKGVEKVAQGPAKPSDPDSAEAKPEFNGGEAKVTQGKASQKNDTTEVEGTILEIPSKGVYRVYVNKPMALGSNSTYVVVDGIVREKDIKPDDSTTSEAIYNMKVDAVNLKRGAQSAAENAEAK